MEMDRHETLIYGALGDVEELVEEGNVVGFSSHSLHHGQISELDDDTLRMGSVTNGIHHDEGIGVSHHLQSHHHLPHHDHHHTVHDAHDPLRVALNHDHHDHHDLLTHSVLPLGKRGHDEITEAEILNQAKKYKLDSLSPEEKERALLIRLQMLEEEVSKWKEMYEEERARRLEEHDHVYEPTNPPVVYANASMDHDHQDGHDAHDAHDAHEHHHHHHLEHIEGETDSSDEQPQQRQAPHRRSAKKKKPKEIPDTSDSSEDELTEDQLRPMNIDNGTEEQWLQRYTELEALVIKKERWPRLDGYHHPLLFNWINKQVEKKERNLLQEKYINLLNKLSFDWKKRRTVVPWDDHFKKLESIRATTGGFSLNGTKYRNNQTFFYWIRNQKREIKRGVVPADRYEKLKELGFVDHVLGGLHGAPDEDMGDNHTVHSVGETDKLTFTEMDGLTTDIHQDVEQNGNITISHSARKFTKQQLDKDPWRYFVPKLEEFKMKFGHTNPPFNPNNNEYHDLAGWVFYVRSERKKNKKMSDELVSTLDSLGFDWNKEPAPSKKTSKKPDKKPKP